MPYRLHVVYRTIPTSNHNPSIALPHHGKVVYRTIPTSNHNAESVREWYQWLYIVLFLHQTTTIHQTDGFWCVVYRTIPTSNHNTTTNKIQDFGLYIVLFLHQTTTYPYVWRNLPRCISYYSYIKPQRNLQVFDSRPVVYRTIPTSNHNWSSRDIVVPVLYIVLFLHQTTTLSRLPYSVYPLYIVLFLHQTTTTRLILLIKIKLYIVLFLHQTTTAFFKTDRLISCISYYSYIKPQRQLNAPGIKYVVYRTIPTSNHNLIFSHHLVRLLYIVLFLHQTTTDRDVAELYGGCISYYSYIKPQLFFFHLFFKWVVYRTIPTSNHNWN